MPDIFDIDFNQQVVDILPPDKRDTQPVTLLRSLLNSLQWARDLVLGGFKLGHFAPKWSPGAYPTYYQVVWRKSIYECIVDMTVNNPDSTDWRLIQPNFIGIDERIRYNGQRIVLEFALNKNFDGIFRQPGSSSLSDINIVNLPAVAFGFRIGRTETEASSIGQDTSSDSIGGGGSPFVQISNFQINFLSSLYSQTNEQAVRNFVNKYIPISLNYTIVTY